MSQNIYDNQTFFDSYAQLPRSRFGLEGAPEWAAVRAHLPDILGKKVIDLGCGYGWFCRNARASGAAEVTGIDLSEKMLSRARALTQDAGIRYHLADLANLNLPKNAYDLAYSSLAFHYLPDLTQLFANIYQALRPEGWLVFTTEHPIYTCPIRQGWLNEDNGQRSWAVNHYQHEGPRVSSWLVDGVIKYHRTLGTTLNALIATGFIIRHVDEWGPSDVQIEATPDLAEEAQRPMIVLISAQR